MFFGVDMNLIAIPNIEISLSDLSILPAVFASLLGYMATHLMVHRRVKQLPETCREH